MKKYRIVSIYDKQTDEYKFYPQYKGFFGYKNFIEYSYEHGRVVSYSTYDNAVQFLDRVQGKNLVVEYRYID